MQTPSPSQVQQELGIVEEGNITPPPLARSPEPSRKWRDIFWLGLFIVHMVGLGLLLAVLGINRFRKVDRLRLNRFTDNIVWESDGYQTEKFWPIYAVSAALGALLAWITLRMLCLRPDCTIKIAVHSLTTYLAVLSVFCFRDKHIFFGIAFAVGALLQFVYTMSVMDRMPFTTLVLRKAVKLVVNIPSATRVSYAFIVALLLWLALWSFGVAGVVASGMGDQARWLLILVLCISLFWTAAVFCNTVHVVVAGAVVLSLCQEDTQIPPRPILRSLQHALTTSLGSICYGSLFTAAIRTMRWAIRGLRSRIEHNECLLCCVDFLFNLVETLVRFFNKYAYVEVAMYGKSFNQSARDAWELFQSTGIEVVIAYDLSGAILFMEVVLCGLVTGTCVGIWAWFKWEDRMLMIGATSMLIGMILVGLGLVVVESAVTSLYMCYATDPALISRWDPEFAAQIAETLLQRLQHRSGRGVPKSQPLDLSRL